MECDRKRSKLKDKESGGTFNSMLSILFRAFPVAIEKGDDLRFWRERILLVTLCSGVLFAFFPFIQGMKLAFEERSWGIALADALFYGVAVALIVFRRIRFEIRAGATLFMLLVLGLIILNYRGPVTSGLIYLFGFSVFAGVLLGLRASLVGLGVNAWAVVTIGWLIDKSYFPWVSQLGITVSKWIVTSGNFLFLSGAASLSIAVLVKGLEASLISEIRTSEELEKEAQERKLAQQALAESEKKYRQLVQFAPAGIVEIDLSTGKLLTVNDVLSRYSGYSQEELMRMNPLEFLEGDSRRRFVDRMQRLIQGETVDEPAEYMLTNRNGKTFWIESNVASIQSNSDTPKAMITLHDITKRKLSEDRLKESEERYRTLYDSVHDMICIHDMDGKIIKSNPAMAEIFGYDINDLVGKQIYNLIPQEYRKDFFEGEHHYIEYNNVLIQASGKTPYVTGIGRDITDRIAAQRELRLLEEKLSQAQKMEAVGTLAGGIAHDFNNLLQVISGYTEFLLQKKSLDRTALSNIEGIEQAVERGEELVRRLLVFSHKEARRMEPVDLNMVIKDGLRILERTIPQMITIETGLSDDLRPVKGNAVQLEQILMNLGTNARDAMPEGGTIRIRTSNQWIGMDTPDHAHQFDPGEYVVLEFSDTGSGMSQDISSRIFEPFFTTKGVGKGTGLGLATVYGIVKAHGGYITCSSELGKGARFLVYIPALEGEGLVVPKAITQEKSIPAGHETVLVVDDDEAILNIAGESLKSCGYEVVPASSGEEALRLYEEKRVEIDLVVLDLGMPGIGGRKALDGLLKLNPDARVLVASGYTSDAQIKEVMGSGASDFIGKPYRISDLMLKVRTILDSGT
ncbi:MAG: PAS domain S-box protein [Deltaproteobacteria bacterium]|nr:PAS domain S-box protein [Deltaproteobacteria bacterium]